MPVQQRFILALVVVIAWGAFIVLGLTNGYHGYYVAIGAGLGVAIYPLARGPVPRNGGGEDGPGSQGPWPDRAALPELLRRRRERRASR
jgi:hypothetical protein